METSRLRRATAIALGFALAGGAGVFAGTLTVRPGVPSVGGLARYTGNHGLEVDVAVPDRNPAYVQTSQPSAEANYRARFFVNLRGLTMVDGNEFDLFSAYDGGDPTPPTTVGNVAFRIAVRQTAGVKKLVAFVRTDTTGEAASAEYTVVNGWRMVEVDFAKSTAGTTGTGNGHLSLWIDGVQQSAPSLTAVDNDNSPVNYARLGAVAGVDASTSGTFKLDDFASQRSGYIGPIQLFTDVPTSYPFYKYVQGLYASEITSGCAVGQYCPGSNVSREQMAVFLVRAVHGATFVPPPATGVFSDVSLASFTAPFIEQFFNDGITTGCATSPLRFCPGDPVTRAQMAVFLLRSEHGSSYTPPAATGIFADVPNDFTRPFIEQLFNEGVTSGCATSPLRYCPADAVSRGQMAVFIIRTFSLPPQEIGP